MYVCIHEWHKLLSEHSLLTNKGIIMQNLTLVLYK